MSSVIATLVREGKLEELAEYARKEFGVSVDFDDFKKECIFGGLGWMADPRMWLKVRLENMGCFKVGKCDLGAGRLTVPLHVFFIHIEENEIHLSNLRNDNTTPSQLRKEEQEIKDSLARSKVFDTTRIIHPINRVAARVAPEPNKPPEEEK